MARSKPPADQTSAADNDGSTYSLGPQDDGSIVLRIPDDYHLMALRKAIEKQEKNAGAADGTLSALAEGEDPWLEKLKRALTRLRKVISTARAPENQIADTPLGKEMKRAAASNAPSGEADGSSAWAAWVPKPRPKTDEPVVFADGTRATIFRALGFDSAAEAFDVFLNSENNEESRAKVQVIAHLDGESLVWRLKGALYDSATVPPHAGTFAEIEKLSQEEAPAQEEAPVGTDAAGEPQQVAPGNKARGGRKAAAAKKTATSSASQRERNRAHNGLAKGGKKRGGK